MMGTKKASTLSSAMLSGLKAGAITGLLGFIVYAFFIFKTSYSDSILNGLYGYYAYAYATTSAPLLTQAQFATLQLFLFATAPLVVGIPVGPVAALMFRTALLVERKRRVQAIVALTSFWVAQALYGYLLLPAAYGGAFLEIWISASFFTALPFGYFLVRYCNPRVKES